MSAAIKSALLLAILSICVLGALFAPVEIPRDREPGIRVVPVKNIQPQRVWLRV